MLHIFSSTVSNCQFFTKCGFIMLFALLPNSQTKALPILYHQHNGCVCVCICDLSQQQGLENHRIYQKLWAKHSLPIDEQRLRIRNTNLLHKGKTFLKSTRRHFQNGFIVLSYCGSFYKGHIQPNAKISKFVAKTHFYPEKQSSTEQEKAPCPLTQPPTASRTAGRLETEKLHYGMQPRDPCLPWSGTLGPGHTPR